MATSKKVSTLWCGKVMIGGPANLYAKSGAETFFELSMVSSAAPAPSRMTCWPAA